jgi:hypothetical protein
MRNLWTKSEDTFLTQASLNGCTAHQIGATLKRTVAAVLERRKRLRKLGNKPDKIIVEKVTSGAFYIEGGLIFNAKPTREYNYNRPDGAYDLTELNSDMCRFPLTDTLPHYFCGKKIHRGAYCEECAKKCYK